MRAETFVGLWGFAGAIDRLAGTLETYPDQMAKLTLAGSLRSTMDFNSEERYPVIHGLTPEGKLITLLDSVEVQYTASLMHGYPTQQLGTQLVFVGGLFSSPDDVLARIHRWPRPERRGNDESGALLNWENGVENTHHTQQEEHPIDAIIAQPRPARHSL